MKIFEVRDRDSVLIGKLVELWEASVRATHDFLSNEEILKIKEYVPSALKSIPHLIIAEENDVPLAFMGIEDSSLEMLFISPLYRGRE